MAICSNCGAESPRIRTIINRAGEMRDECPACTPQSFEAIKDPSTQKFWIGPEYNPNAYEKRYDQDGVYYVAKPEFTAEQEAKVRQGPTDETEQQEAAARRKRIERRTDPMNASERGIALRKAQEIAAWLQESADEERKKQELEAWVDKAGRA